MDLNNSNSGRKNGYANILFGDGNKAHFRYLCSSFIKGNVDAHGKNSKLGQRFFGYQRPLKKKRKLEIHV